jgi:hypothetical protein
MGEIPVSNTDAQNAFLNHTDPLKQQLNGIFAAALY